MCREDCLDRNPDPGLECPEVGREPGLRTSHCHVSQEGVALQQPVDHKSTGWESSFTLLPGTARDRQGPAPGR